MTTQEIIDQLKKNEKPFGLMSEEMQEMAKEINGVGVFLIWMGDKWLERVRESFESDYAYRLNPDYAEEPEIVECEIYGGRMGMLTYDRGDTFTACTITCACREPDFIGFKFADGSWYEEPIKPVDEHGDIITVGDITVDDIKANRVTVLHATSVLFRRHT